jgi:hypothetical protein
MSLIFSVSPLGFRGKNAKNQGDKGFRSGLKVYEFKGLDGLGV